MFRKIFTSVKKLHGLRHDVRTMLLRTFPSLTQKPVSITISVNDICNSRCTTCYIWKNKDAPQIAYETICGLVKELFTQIGPRNVTLTGGEPLLRRDIYDIIRFIDGKGGRTRMLTNGLLLMPSTIDKLVENGLRYLTISLNSANPQVHDSSRGIPGNHARIMEAVKYVRKNHPQLKIEFVCILFRDNIMEIPQMIEYAKSVSGTISFQPIRPLLSAHKHVEQKDATATFVSLLPDSKEAEKAMDMMGKYYSRGEGAFLPRSYIERYRSYFKDPFHLPKKRVDGSAISISSDGTVRFNRQLPPIGNVTRSPLMDILSGDEAKRQLLECSKAEICLCDFDPTPQDIVQLGKDTLAQLFDEKKSVLPSQSNH